MAFGLIVRDFDRIDKVLSNNIMNKATFPGEEINPSLECGFFVCAILLIR